MCNQVGITRGYDNESEENELMEKPRIFWGWYIVAASVVLSAYNVGLFSYGFTAFINPIAATYGWSYAQISLAMSLQGLESGALNPLLGMVVDRYPLRRLIFIGVFLLGLGMLWASRSTNLLSFYLGFIVMGFGSSLSTHMVPNTAIARWFRKDVGKASGIVAMGMGFGGAFVPLVVGLIDTCGWQQAFFLLALGVWLIGLPLCSFFRSRPEDYGLLPDGKPVSGANAPSAQFDKKPGSPIKKILKMRAFWQIGLVFIIQMSAATTVVTHMMPFLVSIGIERTSAGKIAMLIPIISLFARFPFGMLCDMFVKKHVMALALGLKCSGLFVGFLVGRGHVELIYLFVTLFGLGIAGVAPIRVPILREYFGTKNFGMIYGMGSVFFTLGLITAPPIAGWVFDTMQSYQPVWLVLAGLSLLCEINVATLPPTGVSIIR